MTILCDPVTEQLPGAVVDSLIEIALKEDIGDGDITSDSVIPELMTCRGKIVGKADGVIAGLDVAARVFTLVDPTLTVDLKAKDGDKVQADHIVLRVAGSARSMLKAERVALNYLQHLSGVATMTAGYVKAVTGTKARILDTRKTTPGMRVLEKYATRVGGAVNHRMGLYDAILIKDTHLALVGGVNPAVRATRKANPGAFINVEVSNLQELEHALSEKVPHILLDNFAPGQVREAVSLVAGRAEIEVSGGINVANARAYALAGADYISVGALTHSATALDFSMKMTRY